QRVRAPAASRPPPRGLRPLLLRRYLRMARPAPGTLGAARPHHGNGRGPGQAGPRRQGRPGCAAPAVAGLARCPRDDVHVLGIGRVREDRERNHETHETHERKTIKTLKFVFLSCVSCVSWLNRPPICPIQPPSQWLFYFCTAATLFHREELRVS